MGMIRDFSMYHLDFESPATACKEQRGLLLSEIFDEPQSLPPELRTSETLGIYYSCTSNEMNRTKYAIANYGHFFMQEYYRNIPGVNIAIPIEITLFLSDPIKGIYTFSPKQFFPINGNGYLRELLDSDKSLTEQVNRTDNFWFTTDFEIPFYYRGGEVFEFKGDDDLWVFINGKLTNCDLGGIHASRYCQINLDQQGLEPFQLYFMRILHAERHFSMSNFQISTSVMPTDLPPIATPSVIYVYENIPKSFFLESYDPIYKKLPYFMITKAPLFGKISVKLNQWYPLGQPIIYIPALHFIGNDSLIFISSNSKANSSEVACSFIVSESSSPPIALNSSFEIVVGSTITINLEAIDLSTPLQDLLFRLESVPKFGYVEIIDHIMNYTSVNQGREIIIWSVSDGTSSSTGYTQVNILNNPDADMRSTTILLASIFGGIIVFGLLGALGTFLFYNKIMAKRFQKLWEEEYIKAKLCENPLYEAKNAEKTNPLYEPKWSSFN